MYDNPDAEAVPAGDIGNHVVPEVIIISTGVVALLAVVIRLMSRYILRKLGIVEILLIISMVFYIVHHYNAYQVAIYPGLGVHQWQYNAKLASTSHYNFKLGNVFYNLNVVFLKIAILLDWLHTFVPTGTRNFLFWTLWTLIWSNALVNFIGTFIGAFQCPPEIESSTCPIDVKTYNLASGVINVVSDLTILIAPHCVVWKLNMAKAQKMGVSLLFVIGSLATGSAIARVIYVVKAYDTNDILYYSVIINITAIAEQTFGYLVIGIPAIPRVLHNFSCTKYMGSIVRLRYRPETNSGAERGNVWHNSRPRAIHDPWDVGDADTHVLVTILGAERKEDEEEIVTAPSSVHHHQSNARDDSPHSKSSTHGVIGEAVTSP